MISKWNFEVPVVNSSKFLVKILIVLIINTCKKTRVELTSVKTFKQKYLKIVSSFEIL